MSYITALGVANPPHRIPQSEAANFMIRAMNLNEEEARRLRALYKMTGIENRYSVISDYKSEQNFTFYPNTSTLEPFPTTGQRMALYREHASMLSVSAAARTFQFVKELQPHEITHLIVVSCTGMYAPGLDIDLIKLLHLKGSTNRTAINFMGCYAAFNGLKLADHIVKSNANAKVLLICTELCSIHFQREKTDDNFLANALFADGAAALIVEPSPRPGLQFKIDSFFSDIISSGANDMAWAIGDFGFEMKLSSYVPEIIRSGIKGLAQSLLSHRGGSIQSADYFAIHPGGRKILEVIEEELKISYRQNQFAYEVLRQFGNMSSPTVLFVLNLLKATLSQSDHGKSVMSLAFGPGLTLESMLLEVHYS